MTTNKCDNPDIIKAVYDSMLSGNTKRGTAQLLGIDRGTVDRIIRKHSDQFNQWANEFNKYKPESPFVQKNGFTYRKGGIISDNVNENPFVSIKEEIINLRKENEHFKEFTTPQYGEFQEFDGIGLVEQKNNVAMYINEGHAIVLSDIHFNHASKFALNKALKYAHERKNDLTHIILNGDIMDCYDQSRYPKIYKSTKDAISKEKEQMILFLEYLQNTFPNVKIIYKLGNHEERLAIKLSMKSPELLELQEFTLRSLLKLDSYGIDYIDDRRFIKLGHLYVAHGHEILGGGIHVAYNRLKATGANILCGHNHKTQSVPFRSISGDDLVSFTVGCLCDLAPEYMRVNQWNWGFAEVIFDKNIFDVNNLRILNRGDIVNG